MTAKLKAIIEKHEKDLGDENCTNPNFENMIRDAVKEDVLDEFLDTLKEAGILLANEDIDKIVKKRILIEINKAREAGLNNK